MSKKDIAIAFAKAIMGWEECDAFTIARNSLVVRCLDAVGGGSIFSAHSDIACLHVATKWAEKHKMDLVMFRHFSHKKWNVTIMDWETSADKICVESGLMADLGEAIMTACVEAEKIRKNLVLDEITAETEKLGLYDKH